MKPCLDQLFQCVQVKDRQEVGGLAVYGLRWDCPNGFSYLTLDEALEVKTLEVTEVHEQGSVPQLRVTNKGDKLVFIMAGEHLVGAKQNRVLNASILVPARSELPIPVSCVEAGRWAYRSPHFASPGSMSHGVLRKLQSKGVLESYRKGAARATANQGEVWHEVARKLGAMGSPSQSHALHQAYADHEASLRAIEDKLPVPRDCNGVAFVVQGELAGADVFDEPATLGKLWPKLIRAFALDALEKRPVAGKPATADTIAGWLRPAGQARFQAFASPGLGQDVRIEGTGLIGAALVVDERPVHVELFPEQAGPAPSQP
jgi:hypothetical protein